MRRYIPFEEEGRRPGFQARWDDSEDRDLVRLEVLERGEELEKGAEGGKRCGLERGETEGGEVWRQGRERGGEVSLFRLVLAPEAGGPKLE